MKVGRYTIEGAKFTIVTMACFVLVAVWHYEPHQVGRDKVMLRQLKLEVLYTVQIQFF
jgi:hypothetical protein